MLVRRLAFALFFVTAVLFAQTPASTTSTSTTSAATETPKKVTPPAADNKTEKVADEAAPKDQSNQPIGADGSKAPNVTIAGVLPLPPPDHPESPDFAKRVKDADHKETEARLGDSIILVATKPDELKNYLEWAASHSKTVTLSINGIDTGTAPEGHPSDGILQFQLEKRTSDNNKVWAALLREPFGHRKRPNITATIAIDGKAAPTHAHFTLVVVKFAGWWSGFWLILLIGFLIATFILTKRYGLLRDGQSVDDAPPPYSLGRCQMAWWFVLIIVSYVLIWLISGDPDTITTSLLGLMGISAGTALGAALIETSAATDPIELQATLAKAQQDLVTAQTALAAAPEDPVKKTAVDAAKTAVNAATQKLNAATKAPKRSWWLREILSDSDGNIVLHRFQIVVWTFVLGVMFVVSVVTELTMPEFSSTLLATMGISSGTYLGFKFPEK